KGVFTLTGAQPLGPSVSASPYAPKLARIDSVGGLDVIAYYGNRWVAWHGNGDGTFSSPVPFPDGAAVYAVADLNGDGLDDAIVAPPTTYDLHVYFNVAGQFVDGGVIGFSRP